MKYGFVKVAAATPHIRVADTQFNTQQIVQQIALASGKRARNLSSFQNFASAATPAAICSGRTCSSTGASRL